MIKVKTNFAKIATLIPECSKTYWELYREEEEVLAKFLNEKYPGGIPLEVIVKYFSTEKDKIAKIVGYSGGWNELLKSHSEF